MIYSTFGNTSNRVEKLLYNFEKQLILFNDLFKNAKDSESWDNNSILQIRYLEALKQNGLLKTSEEKINLGSKDARVKSAPLEDYGLINRKQKLITNNGYELLDLIQNQSYKITNEFLQIDLISLFFLKISLDLNTNVGKFFRKILKVFRLCNGEISINLFKNLALIENFTNEQEFIYKQNDIFENLVDNTHLPRFLNDLKCNKFNYEYFKTAKGDKTAIETIRVLKDLFLPFRENVLSENDFNKIVKSISSNFKNVYLNFLFQRTKKISEKISILKEFVSNGDLESFGKRFWNLIFMARIDANLDDYLDLNRRYLNLSGIFEFNANSVKLNMSFKIILESEKYNEILEKITTSQVSQNMLN